MCVCFVVVVVLGGLLPFTCLDLVNAEFSPEMEVIEGIPGGREVTGGGGGTTHEMSICTTPFEENGEPN